MDRHSSRDDDDTAEPSPEQSPSSPPSWATDGPDPADAGRGKDASASAAGGASATGEASDSGAASATDGGSASDGKGVASGASGASPPSGSSEALECAAFGDAVQASCAAQAGVLEAAVDLVIEVRDRVLARRELVGVELGKTAAKSVLADVKRCAVTEVQLKAGYGVTEARTLVALALAAERLRDVITDSMRRGESVWPLVRHFWETSAQLTDDQRFLVATALFGLDEGLAVPERLDPDGGLLTGEAWSHDSFTAACDREVAACEGIDVIAERERRRRAYAARTASLRLNDDGTGTLSVRGPIASLAAVYQRIDKGARNARAQGDERTLANLRCDLITALLLYGTVAELMNRGRKAGSASAPTATGSASAPTETGFAGAPTETGTASAPSGTEPESAPSEARSGTESAPQGQTSDPPGSPGAPDAPDDALVPDHDPNCPARRAGDVASRGTDDGAPDGAGRGAADGKPGPCDCGAVNAFDEIIAPEQMDLLIRVINALPSIALQVVVPLEALTPVINRCPTCGEDARGAHDLPDGQDDQGETAPRAGGDRSGEGVGEDSARNSGIGDVEQGDDPGHPDTRHPDARHQDHQDTDRPATDDPGDDSVPEWMRVLGTWLPSGPGRGLVGEALGPVPFFLTPGQARELALTPGTTIHRLITDPGDGRCVERTRKGYRPDADMRRQIQAADVYSRRPGSRTHFAACELDHVTPLGWAGGPTAEGNLATLELRAHKAKTDGYLDLTINHRRDLTFTTLLGQVLPTRVHDYGQYLRTAAPDDVQTRRDLANRVIYAAYAADPGRGEAPEGLTRPVDHDSWITVTHTVLGRRRPGPGEDTPTVGDLLGLPDEGDETDGADETGGSGETGRPDKHDRDDTTGSGADDAA